MSSLMERFFIMNGLRKGVKAELATKLNINNVIYVNARQRGQGACTEPYVTFSPSQKLLSFNKKMIHLLDIDDSWQSLRLGIDPESEIILLKKADPFEVGSAVFYKQKKKSGAFVVCVNALMKEFPSLEWSRKYIAERIGNMILLQSMKAQ